MENLFEITLQNRKILYKFLKNTPKVDLLRIPYGFRNSIWWNIAHVVVTQQLLFYSLSGLKMKVNDDLVNKFKKGTVPDGTAADDEIEAVSSFLFSTVEWAQDDYEKGLFKDFNEYTTSVNISLKTIEDAVAFNVYHEGLHLGVILSLQKALMKS